MLRVRLLGIRASHSLHRIPQRPKNLRYFAMAPGAADLSPAHLASIDLSDYDAEQSRLMDERCILVDEQDHALGAADKKTCTCLQLAHYCDN